MEADETFAVTLSNPSSGLVLGTETATGTIRNDDASVSIAAQSADRAEGDSGTTTFTFTATQIGDVGTSHNVSYTVTGSGASPATAANLDIS